MGHVVDLDAEADTLLNALAHQERLQKAFMHLVGFSSIDLDGRYQVINAAYADACGYTQEEMVGMQWSNTVHPDSIPAGLAAYGSMLATGYATLPLVGVRKDGTKFNKRVTILTRFDGSCNPDGHYCLMISTPGEFL